MFAWGLDCWMIGFKEVWGNHSNYVVVLYFEWSIITWYTYKNSNCVIKCACFIVCPFFIIKPDKISNHYFITSRDSVGLAGRIFCSIGCHLRLQSMADWNGPEHSFASAHEFVYLLTLSYFSFHGNTMAWNISLCFLHWIFFCLSFKIILE